MITMCNQTYYGRNLKHQNLKSPFLKLPLHDLTWIASEVFAIYDSHFQHIHNYVSNFHTQEWAINNYVVYKNVSTSGKKWDVLTNIHKPKCPSFQNTWSTRII